MLELKHITKVYNTEPRHLVEVISDLTLSVADGEFIALVGPSGCGKTTLLKMVAGLVPQTSGEIFLDKQAVSSPGKERGIIFQNFSLFPWLTVRDNIAFGLNLCKMDKQKKETAVNRYLRITGLEKFASFYPRNLSGGMQQRVAVARTLANNPRLLLMDEPFGSLDEQTRSLMQEFLIELWEKERKTVIFVTHDVREAIFLADTVYVTTPRPLAIKQKFAIPFARPRSHALKLTKEFFDWETRVAHAIATDFGE
ncbi:MAG: hypothetical protein A2249_03215 [Candidatus Jacksonbacteria bacterium RIFOXYA2_FULL_44_7]|uniref:ABC transporter domain-containing protein n=1 Tax=Candidatus Jacksonbacteria bacterium RIFCSPLOWO2_02_FULL_44_20 TaxID=1798460 RepID=A0A1G2A736_9BACT|nr:MAG: ABC transporter related protein [Parcubacteria group bacterium GW2011_GWC2_44_17]KKT50167.1 MAG: ABC transporter related protein [Parcubacteria group bacterium GW2011_GWF2_44_17]OGY70761.1 MAG: hypothetical protein A3E05_01195 [Candidatus Jacksonbacteria bacterium RIFCSPHIGHO2_12_FULL_44_12]OGY71749.1 MAG: hypothetical protein A3C00_04520 [Candidatus Jacksonbacteria bacterium RIFCSPHIGHO2_02_FULL_44_25]OGY72286.1 MAG: hypothetical protein A3H61_00685 [Candidatus Jacksonbacteria bacteriu